MTSEQWLQSRGFTFSEGRWRRLAPDASALNHPNLGKFAWEITACGHSCLGASPESVIRHIVSKAPMHRDAAALLALVEVAP